MKTGNVYRAKEKMIWAGLILLICPWVTYQVGNYFIEDRTDFWFIFIMVGIFWTLVFYSYVVKKIWEKINKRHVNHVVRKVINYHKMCISSIINEDYERAQFILDKCLEKYDPKSSMTFYIRGAIASCKKDLKELRSLELVLKEAKV